ncbi:MAG: hypothetical protein ACJAS1_001364 [Oleiphilaceae bacterium]|jgi:hypothetical protein
MNIAIIDSPLQALNSIEYLSSCNLNNKQCCFIIFSNVAVSNSNLEQIEFVLELFGYSNRLILNVNGGFKGLIKSREKIKFLARKLSKDQVQKCLLGEYRSLAAKALVNEIKPEQLIVVDDGNATLRINRVSSPITISGILKKLLARIFNLKITPWEKITFFSVYGISKQISLNDQLVFNDYSFLKTRMSEYSNSEKEFIIGSPLQAAGVVEDDLALTLILIGNILSNKKTSKSELIYISHRRESKSKLAEIAKYGIKVVSLAYPFELYALMNKENAVKINGFYSSLFPNLLNLNNEISITAYSIASSIIQPQFQEFVSNVYNSYQCMSDPRLQLKSLIHNE